MRIVILADKLDIKTTKEIVEEEKKYEKSSVTIVHCLDGKKLNIFGANIRCVCGV